MRIAPGTRYEAPVQHIDIMPTIAAAAGAALPDDRVIDGVDFVPFVMGEREGVPHDTLFWRQGYLQTVLHRGWKLITSDRPDTDWLFDLEADPTEQENLAMAQPQRVAELKALLAAHNANQAPPAWESYIEVPVLVDKHGLETYEQGDEYSYFPN